LPCLLTSEPAPWSQIRYPWVVARATPSRV
jgi:hypothetical protein